MAIGFARLEFVTRSKGQLACCKAAYNARSKVHQNATEFNLEKTFNWSHLEQPILHEVMLPEGVNQKFKNMEILWNSVEKKENRMNSQLQMEVVLALPDDDVITIEDRKTLVQTFVKEHFVANGLAAQVDIHPPSSNTTYSEETGELEKFDHNWHAHILIPTRRFKDNGEEFEDHKARDLVPVVRNGVVISGPKWGELWRVHQNNYFREKGIDLEVDSKAVTSQIHLGPYRLRARAFGLLEENENLIQQNKEESKKPENILMSLTKNKNVFTSDDLQHFLAKHFDGSNEELALVKTDFWKQSNIIQLFDRSTHSILDKFTTQEILAEEKQIMRIADRIQLKPSAHHDTTSSNKHIKLLNEEQKNAFHQLLSGQKLACLEGHAGTGKSHLLNAIKNTYEEQGYIVRGLGPDNATAQVLSRKGFTQTQNVHQFLYSAAGKSKKNPMQIKTNKEVWIVDESGKLGNAALLELVKLADKKHAHLIFSGCTAQMGAVERGDMFRVFCQKYGSSQLEDIQRQEKEIHRQIAKKLAHGNLSAALEQIIKTGGIHWSITKEEAFENIALSWAFDKSAYPHQTSIIIAHTNKEVKVLNEYVRLYRLEKGEISKKELECETMAGKVYVSKGDLIEFRKNDNNLNVSNGTRGVLIEATTGKFVVQVKDKAQVREVSFDPKTYFQYQLGYATTFYRSQGDNVDRAYVLHSPNISTEMFYVGLTRHVKNVSYFVAKQYTKSVAHLKMQIKQQSVRESTTDFITQKDILEPKLKGQRQEKIDTLKQSSSILQKIKGHGIQIWDQVVRSTSAQIEKIQDRVPDQKFYNYKGEGTENVAKVANYNDPSLSKTPSETMKALVEGELNIKIQAAKKFSKPQKYRMDLLEPKQQEIYKRYVEHASEASILCAIVMAETEGKSGHEKSAPHFIKWQEACGKRNESAYAVLQAVPQKEMKKALPQEAFAILNERSSRFKSLRQLDRQPTLDYRLKENLESLLCRLFPEGPTSKHSQGLRFGSKGSLAVHCTGDKRGSFYDFEQQKGGGPTSLIRHVLFLDAYQAREWGENFLGNFKNLEVNPSFKVFHRHEKADNWISIKPTVECPAPSLEKISRSLAEVYKEDARYPYKNEKGELLFYVLRLVDKNDPHRKITPPLSYGHWGSDNSSWNLKGSQDELKPIYNLDQLYQKPGATILIVEGEKTADAATKLFQNQNIVSITFSGGAGAVFKTDWKHLLGREVIIWPDNDKAGFKAADDLVSELRKQGINSLKVIDTEMLKKSFPEKWDLADALPSGIKDSYPKELMLRARDKTLGLSSLLTHYSHIDKGFDPQKPANILICHEILSRLENRQWASLEVELGGKIWEIKSAIQADSIKSISTMESIRKEMIASGLKEDQSQVIAFGSMLFQALNGREPQDSELQKMKAVSFDLCQLANQQSSNKKEQEVFRLIAVASYVDSGAISSSKGDFKKTFEKVEQHVMMRAASVHKFNEFALISNERHHLSIVRQAELSM
ncbi:MAG: AAA family ATPase [Chlamydiales bacterium]